MKELICIVCPKGCHLHVQVADGSVTGAGCPRGISYGLKEVTSPTRVLTSTVRIMDAIYPRLPVKTSSDLPKALIWDAMSLLDTVCLKAPVREGDVVVPNICGSGVDWIATKTLESEADSCET